MFIVSLVGCDRKSQVNEENDKIMYTKNKDLSSRDYMSYKTYMPIEGLIPTEEIAIQVAEIVLSKIYGIENIKNQKPFSINLEDDIWIIEGYLDEGSLGGVAYIEISKSNGAILKVIHTK